MNVISKGMLLVAMIVLVPGSASAAGAAAKAASPAYASASAMPSAPVAPREMPAAPELEPAPPDRLANPSFPCAGGLSVAEALICASVRVSDLDRAMTAAYSASVEGLVGPVRARAVDAQRRWLGVRNSCRDERCLLSAYQSRIEALESGSGVVATAQPSFDCTQGLGAAEAAVCADPSLADLDQRMSTSYSLLAGTLDAASRQRLAATQRRWMTRRNACGARTGCLRAAYSERLAAISGWSEAGQE